MALFDEPAINGLTGAIIKAAIEVHKQLGPGLLESIYCAPVVMELRAAQLSVITNMNVPVIYKGVELEPRLKLDILVNDTVIVEVKAVQSLVPLHEAQC